MAKWQLNDISTLYFITSPTWRSALTWRTGHFASCAHFATVAEWHSRRCFVYNFSLRQITRRSQSTVVNFLCGAWLLRGIAYNKDGKCGSQYVIGTPKRKRPPPGAAISERGSFLVLTALQPSVKPLTNVVRSYICSDGQDKCGNIRHWTTPPFP